MTVTLGDYARQQYPGHSTDLWRGLNPPLHAHTVVVHVVGRDSAEQAICLLERSTSVDDVAAVLVLGSESTVLPSTRRFVAAARAAIDSIVGGGGRPAPGEDIGVVAALVDDEGTATAIADELGNAGMFDVRIVSSDGAWHSPS